jgi:hypothetical protein
MRSMLMYALITVATLISASLPAHAHAAEAWIQTPRVENRQTNLTPTSWSVLSRYTGGVYTDASGIVRTAEVTLANAAVLRTGGVSGAGLWDVSWSITNEGSGDFTRFVAIAGGLPHFLRDVLTTGETEFESATVIGSITLAQWNGQWGNTLTGSGGAVYFLAAAVPEPGTMALLGVALLAVAGFTGGVPAAAARSRALSRR